MWEEEYSYCYVHLVTPRGKRTTWKRIPRSRVDEWIDTNQGALSYFSTVQSFSGADKRDGELHWSPIFFDMDAPDDVPEQERLEKAYIDTRLLIDYFLQGFDIEPKVWFTGGRGFHILVPGYALGAAPDRFLTYHWRHIAERIKKKLEVETLDLRVYTIPRMWRISNQQHQSGKYKIPLELTELNQGLDFILGNAKTPRTIPDEDDPDENQVSEGLTLLYKEEADKFEERWVVHEGEEIDVPQFGEDLPPCVKYLFDEGLAELGTKNRADMALANYCKASGLEIDKTIILLSEWAKGIPRSLTHVASPAAREAQTVSVIRAVYSNSKYRFSCGSMRSCGMEVDCKQCGVEERSQPKEIALSDFSKAENFGLRVIVEADIVGRDMHEMIVPRKIKGWCDFTTSTSSGRLKEHCSQCKMSRYYNREEDRMQRLMVFDGNESLTLSLLDVSKNELHHRIKRVFGIKDRCYDFHYEVEWGNANVLYLATRIYGKFGKERAVTRSRAIYLGHDIELNQGYKMQGVVWAHPRNSKAILVVDKIEMLQSSLANFTLSDDGFNDLDIFKAYDQAPLDKIREIHGYFMDSFIRVYGREQLVMAVDLAYHSARRMNFQRDTELRAWLDILILGDTGQGKTDIVEKIMRYYDLGVLAVGETASRTGLLYTIHAVAGEEMWIAYGLLCRASGYLVVIDEVHGMHPNDFAEFTRVRSAGMVDVVRAASGAAKAETRLISIANARKGKSLASFAMPVQAIADLDCFKALEDVRRWDYAVGAMAGEIGIDIINRDATAMEVPEHPYTAEQCRNLILWIWTRTPDQIKIERSAELLILKHAKQMSVEYIPEIPLVEAADVRHKIARVAIAVAGRVFSSPDCEHLVVKEEHVRAAYRVLDEFYDADGLKYKEWSADRAAVFHSPEQLAVLMFDFKAAFTGWEVVARWLLDQSDFVKGLVRTATSLSGKEADQLMSFLLTHRFITTERNRFVKTPSGRMFLQQLFKPLEEKEVDEGKDEF